MRTPTITALVSMPFLVLGAAFATAESVEVDATIQKVNQDERSLTVEMDETGAMRTFQIDDSTQITFGRLRGDLSQLRRGFDDLRAGQEVTLRFDEEVPEQTHVILHIITIG